MFSLLVTNHLRDHGFRLESHDVVNADKSVQDVANNVPKILLKPLVSRGVKPMGVEPKLV